LIRVLNLIDHLGLGGSQRLLLDVAEVGQSGVEHTILALTDRVNSDNAERLSRLGVEQISLGARRSGPATLVRLRSVLKRFRPDVLHTRLDVSNTLGAACALSLASRHPVIVLTLENDLDQHYSRWSRTAFRATASLADAVVCLSDSLRRASPVLDRVRRLEVIPPGVNLDYFRTEHVSPENIDTLREGSPLVVGSLGRLTRQKGHDLLVEALPTLLRAEPGVLLLIGGDGPELSRLSRRARELGVHDRLGI
jgi:glycosyltransferase involved in cell wall biosynthesis